MSKCSRSANSRLTQIYFRMGVAIKMLQYQFTDDCLIGIEQIDAEHRKLFSMVNEAMEVLHRAEDEEQAVVELILNLRNYAIIHFRHEEEHMEKNNDPELERQKKEHEAFREKVYGLSLDEFEGEAGRNVLEELLVFLSHWLYRHILGSDIFIRKGEEKNSFAFTSKYEIGIPSIDEEHRQLFALIEETDRVIHSELLYDKYDEIVNIIDGLRDYTQFHFKNEEAYMESIGYDGLEAQKITHQAFIDKLNEIDLFSVDENQQESLEDLISFLLNWLVSHIMKMDKKIPA